MKIPQRSLQLESSPAGILLLAALQFQEYVLRDRCTRFAHSHSVHENFTREDHCLSFLWRASDAARDQKIIEPRSSWLVFHGQVRSSAAENEEFGPRTHSGGALP